MSAFFTLAQIALLFGGFYTPAFGPLGLLLSALCAAAIIYLQRLKVRHQQISLTPNNKKRSIGQTMVLSIGTLGFMGFYAIDSIGHVDTTGAPTKDVLIAVILSATFIAIGMYRFRYRD